MTLTATCRRLRSAEVSSRAIAPATELPIGVLEGEGIGPEVKATRVDLDRKDRAHRQEVKEKAAAKVSHLVIGDLVADPRSAPRFCPFPRAAHVAQTPKIL